MHCTLTCSYLLLPSLCNRNLCILSRRVEDSHATHTGRKKVLGQRLTVKTDATIADVFDKGNMLTCLPDREQRLGFVQSMTTTQSNSINMISLSRSSKARLCAAWPTIWSLLIVFALTRVSGCFVVLSGSMEPQTRTGDVLFGVYSNSAPPPRVGDILVYRLPHQVRFFQQRPTVLPTNNPQ